MDFFETKAIGRLLAKIPFKVVQHASAARFVFPDLLCYVNNSKIK